MVLPVEYTKGLEFDAVLLYHPSEEHYPSEDAYVKLLYVAATRALHELAVVHTGDLTDLIGTKVSEEKRIHSLENQVHKESQALRKKPAPVEKKASDPVSEKASAAEARGPSRESGSTEPEEKGRDLRRYEGVRGRKREGSILL